MLLFLPVIVTVFDFLVTVLLKVSQSFVIFRKKYAFKILGKFLFVLLPFSDSFKANSV